MREQEKQQWRDWFRANPDWADKMAEFFNLHPELVGKDKTMFWHDMVNALVPVILERQLKQREGKK